MTEAESSTSLFCLIAREAPVAVVFRRGPSTEVQLLSWNLATDEIGAGQWLKGRIYERRSDLSPAGDLLLYFAANYKPPYRSWTALSRPPFLTALALWPKGDTWGGGGLLDGERTVRLNHRDEELQLGDGFQLPDDAVVTQYGERPGWGEDSPLYDDRLQRDGWSLTVPGQAVKRDGGSVAYEFDPPRLWRKEHSAAGAFIEMSLLALKEKQGPWYVQTFQCGLGQKTVDLGRCDWADFDHTGDVLFARAGKLFRLRQPLSFQSPYELIDLTGNQFGEMPPTPEAQRWE